MGFFQKLKDRLFNLTPETKPDKPNKNLAINNQVFAKTKEVEAAKTAQKLVLAQKKVSKQVAKDSAAALAKADKVNKYVVGLSRPGESFAKAIKEVQARHAVLDEAFFNDLEEALIMADISLKLVTELIAEIKREVRIEKISAPTQIAEIVADKMFALYANRALIDTSLNVERGRTNVILVVGVNGAGKTTTIAKLAQRFINEGLSVTIAAADTFRAGAVEQLNVWATRVGANFIKSSQINADPASVVYDAVQAIKANGNDVLIVDTAGRLQNKVNLMNELAKMSKILSREIPGAPHESLLVLDATTGQNGVLQAAAFKDVTPLTGIVLTKMDGTAKGGIILTIRDQLGLAVKLVGLGEKLDDLQEFDLDAFIYGLTKNLEVTN